ncbi:MAG: methyl-accepting chemotaxis protein [Spirochaetaceae bacterium]
MMKIKAKLLTLIFSILTAMIISMGSYIGFQLRITKIENEKKELETISSLMKMEIIELTKFLTDRTPILKQSKELKDIVNLKKTSIFRVKDFKSLPNLSLDVKVALDTIVDLELLQSKAEDKLYTSINALFNTIDSLDSSFAIQDINRSKTKLLPYFNELSGLNNTIKKQLGVVILTLESSERAIHDQYIIIDNYAAYFKRIGLFITMGIMLSTLLISVIVSITSASKITKSIKKLESSLSVMATGNLIHNIHVKSSDEIGLLSDKMSTFQSWLSSSLNKIKNSSRINEEVKEELVATTTETSAAAVEISANINSIDSKISMLDNHINQSKQDSVEISEFSSELNEYIFKQITMVKESGDSISNMISSISEISLMTNHNKDILKLLERTVLEGDEKLSETNDIIDDINSSVNEINSMTEIIQNISDQTNLLSMNAAIEAAHAGDAGKGFAVVADEIRKLAVASTQNSKDISSNLKYIITKFENASSAGQNTREAFLKINERIKVISEELNKVSHSTSKLNIDGDQILKTMERLENISSTVQDKSESMNSSAMSINSLISNVSDISNSVTCSISEVNIGFREITDAMSGLKEITDRVEVVSREINDEVNEFQTV